MSKHQSKVRKKTASAKASQAAPFASYMKLSAESQPDEEQTHRAEKEEEWAKKAETDPDREQMEDESDEDYATRMEEMDEEEAEGEIKEDIEAEEEKEDANAKAVRASERKRCARIIANGIKAGNVHQAAVFAFDTSLSATQAISAMNASKMDAPRGGGLGNRMQGVENYHIGSASSGNNGAARNKTTADANNILDAVNAARG